MTDIFCEDEIVLRIGARQFIRILLPTPVLLTNVIDKGDRQGLTRRSELIPLQEVFDEKTAMVTALDGEKS